MAEHHTAAPPVLGADEWADALGSDRSLESLLCYGDGVDALAGLGEPRRSPADCHAALVALANAALPDGHRQKITRADLALVDALRSYMGPATGDPDYWNAKLDALSGKLAAMLPPPGTPCAECGAPQHAHIYVPEHQDDACPSSNVLALTFYRLPGDPK
jgi:hypothetical protein